VSLSLRLASSSGTRGGPTSGLGGGANLLFTNAFGPSYQAAVSTRTLTQPASSTADYYHIDGLYDFVPYDLNAMGTPGQAIATAKGYRYVWIITCDHPGQGSGEEGGWGRDATSVYAAFSNDPAVLPDPSTMCRIINGGPDASKCGVVVPGTVSPSVFVNPFQACLVYNPDDATNPFYLFTEMEDHSGGANLNSLNMILHKRADFDGEFTTVGISHACTGPFGLTSFQNVKYLGGGSWASWGAGNTSGNDGSIAKWTATGQTTNPVFTIGSVIARQDPNTNNWTRSWGYNGHQITIGSDTYIISNEDDRYRGYSAGTTYAIGDKVSSGTGTQFRSYTSLSNGNLNNEPSADGGVHWQDNGQLGQKLVLVPVNATTGAVIPGGSPAVLTLSAKYNGVFPLDTWIQTAKSYEEDGVALGFLVHGMFGDVGLIPTKLPENGGGINDQWVDAYFYVYDAVAAANSAPFGARASCAAGVVTLNWYDVVGGRTFRIKRYTSLANANADTSGTSVGDVTGITTTDSPTVGSVYYYRIWSLASGTPQGSRVVSTYVS
jgi:hypothetical protein